MAGSSSGVSDTAGSSRVWSVRKRPCCTSRIAVALSSTESVGESHSGEEGTRGPIPTKWNVRGWPTIYVLDHEGVIRFKGVRGEAMTKAVEQLLGEMDEGQD